MHSQLNVLFSNFIFLKDILNVHVNISQTMFGACMSKKDVLQKNKFLMKKFNSLLKHFIFLQEKGNFSTRKIVQTNYQLPASR